MRRAEWVWLLTVVAAIAVGAQGQVLIDHALVALGLRPGPPIRARVPSLDSSALSKRGSNWTVNGIALGTSLETLKARYRATWIKSGPPSWYCVALSTKGPRVYFDGSSHVIGIEDGDSLESDGRQVLRTGDSMTTMANLLGKSSDTFEYHRPEVTSWQQSSTDTVCDYCYPWPLNSNSVTHHAMIPPTLTIGVYADGKVFSIEIIPFPRYHSSRFDSAH
jgi:hypothetical protein